MATPVSIVRFLENKRIAVAGVSRTGNSAANAICRKFRDGGYEVFPVNPNASVLEGVAAYPDLASIPGAVDGVLIATPPAQSIELIRQAGDCAIRRVWLHRSVGTGSVSDAAVRECRSRDIDCIVGGCPLMYCEPVDVFHRCLRWWLGWRGRLPR